MTKIKGLIVVGTVWGQCCLDLGSVIGLSFFLLSCYIWLYLPLFLFSFISSVFIYFYLHFFFFYNVPQFKIIDICKDSYFIFYLLNFPILEWCWEPHAGEHDMSWRYVQFSWLLYSTWAKIRHSITCGYKTELHQIQVCSNLLNLPTFINYLQILFQHDRKRITVENKRNSCWVIKENNDVYCLTIYVLSLVWIYMRVSSLNLTLERLQSFYGPKPSLFLSITQNENCSVTKWIEFCLMQVCNFV